MIHSILSTWNSDMIKNYFIKNDLILFSNIFYTNIYKKSTNLSFQLFLEIE